VNLTIELTHERDGRIEGYPLRPSGVEVLAQFSDNKRLEGWADNHYGRQSLPGESWKYRGPS